MYYIIILSYYYDATVRRRAGRCRRARRALETLPGFHLPPFFCLFFQADAGHLVHVFDVFNVYGYTRRPFDRKVEWDVIWAHEYPFKTYADQIVFSNLKPHQKVRVSSNTSRETFGV